MRSLLFAEGPAYLLDIPLHMVVAFPSVFQSVFDPVSNHELSEMVERKGLVLEFWFHILSIFSTLFMIRRPWHPTQDSVRGSDLSFLDHGAFQSTSNHSRPSINISLGIMRHVFGKVYASGGWRTSQSWKTSEMLVFRYSLLPNPPTSKIRSFCMPWNDLIVVTCSRRRSTTLRTTVSKTSLRSSPVITSPPFWSPLAGSSGMAGSTDFC